MWILRYTALYLMVVLPMIALLLISGKTLLWGKDAYYQQYTTLSYTGQAIRRLLSGSGFDMVDLSLGQGMDVIGTLAYYGLTDPPQWLGALYLVLMLICVERILRERKWLMMALVTALMVFANFYLAFSTTLLTVLYILIRLATRLKLRGARASASDCGLLPDV